MPFLNFRLISAAAGVAAAALLAGGCTSAITFSTTERSMGRIALNEGDYETAAEIFSEHVANNPRDYKAHTHLGQTRLAAGNNKAALASFRTALDTRVMTARGRADKPYRELIIDEYARTLALIDADGTMTATLDSQSSGDVEKKLIVAKAFANAGQPDSAIAAFQSARRLDKRDLFVAKSFGLYLESIRQDIAAEEMLTQAYRIEPSDNEVAAGLVRLGIVPGPAILSRNELAKPKVPLGPLPQVRMATPEQEAETAAGASASDAELN
ncbi:MAG: tetratricopeptide repeat protein [Planctomycetota bacterium]